MMKNLLNKGLLITVALAFGTGSAFAALNPNFQLNVTTGGATTNIVDNSAGDLSPATPNTILYSATVNGWVISVVSGVSNSPSATPELDMVVIANCSAASCVGTTATQQLALSLSGSGFNLVSPLNQILSISAISGGSVTQTAGINTTGALFSTTCSIGSGITATTPSTNTQAGCMGTSSYSDTLTDTFTASATGSTSQFSTTGTINAVPEPASITMLGGVLLLAGAFRRKISKA